MQRPAFFALGSFNITKTDLVPLILGYADEADVVYNARASLGAVRAWPNMHPVRRLRGWPLPQSRW